MQTALWNIFLFSFKSTLSSTILPFEFDSGHEECDFLYFDMEMQLRIRLSFHGMINDINWFFRNARWKRVPFFSSRNARSIDGLHFKYSFLNQYFDLHSNETLTLWGLWVAWFMNFTILWPFLYLLRAVDVSSINNDNAKNWIHRPSKC